jgi:membrane protease subunit HflC
MSMSNPDYEASIEGELDENQTRFKIIVRFALATVILLTAIAAACIVMVRAGEAVLITRFGNPVRVVTTPGLAWKLPLPIEDVVPISLELRTTATGLQDVGTRDGLRVLMQAYVAWQVPDNPSNIRQFLRSVRNQPDEAANQLRSFISAAMHITASNFDFSDLVNVDQKKVRIDAFEKQLQDQVASRMLQGYGIAIRQVGIERLTLPADTLSATVARMSAERETVAAQRTAEGLLKAAAIRSEADRDSRETVAQAKEKAAQTLADAQQAAAEVYAKAYKADPGLYSALRSLDTVNQVVGKNTNIILRSDAAPFNVLSSGPGGTKP